MDYGVNRVAPLLTISIPTWNRAMILNDALDNLFSDLKGFESFVEIIVSDNCSVDNTQEIVQNYKKKYPNYEIVYNQNNSNLGFFGNFMKCRELSRGEYLWILSDDDFICKGLLKDLITKLRLNDNIAVFYLNNTNERESVVFNYLSYFNFIDKYRHNSGLISKVIFYNNKIYDHEIFKNYEKSGFIGWILMLNSFRFKSSVCVISKKCLETAKSIPKGYDYFNLFVSGIKDVSDFMIITGLPNELVQNFRRTFFFSLVFPSYLLVKNHGFDRLHGGKLIARPLSSIEEEIILNFYNDKLIRIVMNFTIRQPKSFTRVIYLCFLVLNKLK